MTYLLFLANLCKARFLCRSFSSPLPSLALPGAVAAIATDGKEHYTGQQYWAALAAKERSTVAVVNTVCTAATVVATGKLVSTASFIGFAKYSVPAHFFGHAGSVLFVPLPFYKL